MLHETVAVGVDHIYANDFDGMHITNPLIGEALRRCAAGLVIVTMVVAIRSGEGSVEPICAWLLSSRTIALLPLQLTMPDFDRDFTSPPSSRRRCRRLVRGWRRAPALAATPRSARWR